MSLRELLIQEALCLFCEGPVSLRRLYRDDETGFEEWGEWEALCHDSCHHRFRLASERRANRLPIAP